MKRLLPLLFFLFVGCSSSKMMYYFEPLEPMEPYYPEQWFNEDYKGVWNYEF